MIKRKQLVEELIKSLTQNPSEWVFREYTAHNERTGIRIHIPGSYIYSPTRQKFSIIEGWKISRAVKQCRKIFLMNLLKS